MMDQLSQEAFLVTKEEWCLLMQAAGCTGYTGFSFQQSEMSETEVVKTMYRMVKKDFMHSDGEEFVVSERLSEILETVKNARRLLLVSDIQQQFPAHCCYLWTRAVVSEWMTSRKDTIKWRLCEKEDIFQYLWDEGCFNEMLDVQIVSLDGKTGKEMEKLQVCWQETSRVLRYETPLGCEIRQCDGKVMRMLFDKILHSGETQMDWRCL